MRTSSLQIVMVGLMTFLMSCEGNGENEKEQPDDSKIVIDDPVKTVSCSYTSQNCHNSVYREQRHLMFEGKRDGSNKGIISVYLKSQEIIEDVIEVDTLNDSGERVLLYQIILGNDPNMNYERIGTWEQTINTNLYNQSKFISIYLMKGNKVLDRTVYPLNPPSVPGLPSNTCRAISLESTSVILKTCHTFQVTDNAVVCDMADECSFYRDTTKVYNKIGFFLKNKSSVRFNGGYEVTRLGQRFYLFDFSISDDAGAEAETFTVFDISLLGSAYSEDDLFVIQYSINGGGTKKKVLTAKTQGMPFRPECNQ